jgi:hypothetical protein
MVDVFFLLWSAPTDQDAPTPYLINTDSLFNQHQLTLLLRKHQILADTNLTLSNKEAPTSCRNLPTLAPPFLPDLNTKFDENIQAGSDLLQFSLGHHDFCSWLCLLCVINFSSATTPTLTLSNVSLQHYFTSNSLHVKLHWTPLLIDLHILFHESHFFCFNSQPLYKLALTWTIMSFKSTHLFTWHLFM